MTNITTSIVSNAAFTPAINDYFYIRYDTTNSVYRFADSECDFVTGTYKYFALDAQNGDSVYIVGATLPGGVSTTTFAHPGASYTGTSSGSQIPNTSVTVIDSLTNILDSTDNAYKLTVKTPTSTTNIDTYFTVERISASADIKSELITYTNQGETEVLDNIKFLVANGHPITIRHLNLFITRNSEESVV